MQQLSETYKPADGPADGGLLVLGIALDDAGGKVVKPFYNKLKITYPMLADAPTARAAAGHRRDGQGHEEGLRRPGDPGRLSHRRDRHDHPRPRRLQGRAHRRARRGRQGPRRRGAR
ncbi:MAG: hypothetical protein M0C28_03295 [Candidatus Moduliflexus flocculans]|nr:hypothetical protein [Candidatus Moduliflexus flocculans]